MDIVLGVIVGILAIALFVVLLQQRRLLDHIDRRLDAGEDAVRESREALDGLAGALPRGDSSLADAVSELRQALTRVEQRLSGLDNLVAHSGDGTGALAPGDPAARARARIVEHLRDLGYREVRIEAGPLDLAADPGEIEVEAVRNGTRILGKVSIRGGVIESVDLEPNYALFP